MPASALAAAPTAAPIRTKIVATMGPAVADDATLRALLSSGADVCRLNFSHGTLDEHATMLAAIRQASADLGVSPAILGDLGGPKIRLSEVADHDDTGGMPIRVGDALVIQRQPTVGRNGVVGSTYPGLIDDVEVGHRVLVEDGLLRFLCVGKEPDALHLQCRAGGVLKTRKGVNLPDSRVNLPSITARDWECAKWACDNGLDYLALSFVRKADDLGELREFLTRCGSAARIVAKIEKAEAVAPSMIDAIIAQTDALIIARGDLGVEMDLARVPLIQKDLIRRCQRAGVPTIVATQMLQSMVDNSTPTRAEVSDVANAVFDGTDALMLSGETSVGKFPLGAVHIMRHVAATTEAYLAEHGDGPRATTDLADVPLGGPMARAVLALVEEVGAKVVVIYSKSGTSARVFSKQRFAVPILALSDDDTRLRQMRLLYGVRPERMDEPADLRTLVRDADALVRDKGLAGNGETIVIIGGRKMGAEGTINGVVVHTVGAAQEGGS